MFLQNLSSARYSTVRYSAYCILSVLTVVYFSWKFHCSVHDQMIFENVIFRTAISDVFALEQFMFVKFEVFANKQCAIVRYLNRSKRIFNSNGKFRKSHGHLSWLYTRYLKKNVSTILNFFRKVIINSIIINKRRIIYNITLRLFQ